MTDDRAYDTIEEKTEDTGQVIGQRKGEKTG